MGFDDMVGLQNRCEYWKPVLVIQLAIIMIPIDPGNFHLISWFSRINEVREKDDLPVARESTSWHSARGFLQSQLLVIAIFRFFRIQRKRTAGLAVLAK